MDKYRANETIQELNLRRIGVLNVPKQLGQSLSMEMGDNTKMGYPISATVSVDNVDIFFFDVSNVSSEVCKKIITSEWKSPRHIYVADSLSDNNSDTCFQTELVKMSFEFSSDEGDSGTSEPEVTTPDPCEGKPLMDKNGTCYACDTLQNIETDGSACSACYNRVMVGDFCVIPCGQFENANRPLTDNRSVAGGKKCYPCNTTETRVVPASGSCSTVCPGRIENKERGVCEPCDQMGYFHTDDPAGCLDACPNRQAHLSDGGDYLCGNCPSGQILAGACLPCDTNDAFALGDYEKCTEICPNRVWLAPLKKCLPPR